MNIQNEADLETLKLRAQSALADLEDQRCNCGAVLMHRRDLEAIITLLEKGES